MPTRQSNTSWTANELGAHSRANNDQKGFRTDPFQDLSTCFIETTGLDVSGGTRSQSPEATEAGDTLLRALTGFAEPSPRDVVTSQAISLGICYYPAAPFGSPQAVHNSLCFRTQTPYGTYVLFFSAALRLAEAPNQDFDLASDPYGWCASCAWCLYHAAELLSPCGYGILCLP